MTTTLPELHESGSKIRLLEDSPLAFLNMAFPGGISVPPWKLSLNGRDCFEVDFGQICKGELWRQTASVFWNELQMGDMVAYCISQYCSVPIPCEWAIEVEGQQG